jgi:hypothetical protein
MTADDAEAFNERAGIAEYMGGLSREAAEKLAADEMEAHRAACEARHVANMESNEARAEFINLVAKHRGPEAAQALRVAAYREMRKGQEHGKA